MPKRIELYKRRSAFAPLEHFCTFSINKKNDYIEVTEWANGEGFDVDIQTKGHEMFSLTWGQFRAIKKMIRKLDKEASKNASDLV